MNFSNNPSMYISQTRIMRGMWFCFYVLLSLKVCVKCQHFTINDSQKMKWMLVYDWSVIKDLSSKPHAVTCFMIYILFITRRPLVIECNINGYISIFKAHILSYHRKYPPRRASGYGIAKTPTAAEEMLLLDLIFVCYCT